jgi:hypothetical protein
MQGLPDDRGDFLKKGRKRRADQRPLAEARDGFLLPRAVLDDCSRPGEFRGPSSDTPFEDFVCARQSLLSATLGGDIREEADHSCEVSLPVEEKVPFGVDEDF